jgi:hypothetical protein
LTHHWQALTATCPVFDVPSEFENEMVAWPRALNEPCTCRGTVRAIVLPEAVEASLPYHSEIAVLAKSALGGVKVKFAPDAAVRFRFTPLISRVVDRPRATIVSVVPLRLQVVS